MKRTNAFRALSLLLTLCMFFTAIISASGCSLFISGNIETVETTSINDGWKMARVPDESGLGSALSKGDFTYSDSWFGATVPGTVLTSYYNAGIINDPYYGDNIEKLDQGYFNVDYWYRNEFVVPTSYEGRRIWLNFDGINWKADVYVNGNSVGSIEGAFIRGQFDVTDYVKIGEKNTVAVYIHWCNCDVRDMPSFLCSASWDWMPAIPGRNMGIYKDVYLSASGSVTLDDPFIKTDLNDAYNKAEVSITTQVTNHSDKKVSGSVTGTIRTKNGSDKSVYKFSKNVSVGAGETVDVAIDTFTMKNPELWWPNGLGDPNLYTLNIYFKAGDVSDAQDIVFGVREYSYEYEASTDGGNTPDDDMIFMVNGEKVFCRGGNWGIPESMLNWTKADFYNAIKLSVEEGFTMIRCWHGTSDFDAFYDACDEYGIMVWDEFWLNGSEMPNDITMFTANVEDKIKRLRNHASLAIWCGENEATPPGVLNFKINRLINSLDGTRMYIAASNAKEVTGGITYKVNDLEWYFTNNRNIGFTTEYGCVNVPNVESMRNFMDESDLAQISNDVWDLHEYDDDAFMNKQTAAYTNAIRSRYGTETNIDDFCRKAQLLNYETFKAMFESWNQGMFDSTSGALLWMSQEGWPGLVWQTYDYYMEENGAFFGCRSANEAIHVQYNYSTGMISIINNTLDSYKGAKVVSEIYNMDGSLVTSHEESVDFDKTDACDVYSLFTAKGGDLKNNNNLSNVYFIRLKLYDTNNNLLSENNYWRGKQDQKYTDLNNLSAATFAYESSIDNNGEKSVITLKITNSSSNVAFATRIKAIRDNAADGEDSRILPTYYSDNYITLMPGETKTVIMEYDNTYLCGGNPQVSVKAYNSSESIISIQ